MNISNDHIQDHEPKDSSNSSSKVKVALRIRPLINKELMEGSLKCIECIPQTSQIVIGKDKAFTFDKIYDENSNQDEIYRTFVKDLVLGCFNGYNATVLAYGQTGSGKTYTMGSALTIKPEDTGIISRVIRDIYNEIEIRKNKVEFLIKVTYLEIYNEEIYDLLDSTLTSSSRRLAKPNSSINIREEKDGSISIYGINEEKVLCYDEMIACLERGSLHRSTASTLMNEVSSRSHAIFTITLEQHCLDDLYKPKTPQRQIAPSTGLPIKGVESSASTTGFMTAKFHFVDLAGSERIKKTGASGTVMKEGININRGLLVLGNVISALTEISSKAVHVPYRESKLTRILQDSLGGNSLTGMIACVSPAESNYEESLNTIKYANRARNIQNTPHINRDPQTALISQLKQQIFELQNENNSLKQLLSTSDIKWEDKKMNSGLSSNRLSISPMINNKGNLDMEQEDFRNLKIRLIQMEKLMKKLQSEALNKQKSLNELEISLYSITKERDLLRLYNERIREGKLDPPNTNEEFEELKNKQSILEAYRSDIEKLKLEIQKKDDFTKELQIEYEHLLINSRKDQDLLLEKIRLLSLYKKKIEKLEAQKTLDSDKSSQDHEKSLQEPTDEDEEWLEMENELVSIKASAENELNCMSGALQEKEELLKNITANNMELERDLLDVMKNQYHQKISNLEGELNLLIGEVRKIEGQRDKAISQLNHNQGDVKNREADDKSRLIVVNFKNKILQLENQLKDFRKKEKDQQNLQRLVQNQQNKINDLATEIKTIKQQKLQLNKKYREELEKLEKFKATRNKEKLDWKKKELEKELQISKLKNEKEKMNILMKKKDEEIVNNKKSQELFRNLCNKDFKQNSLLSNHQLDLKFHNNGVFQQEMKGGMGLRRYPTRKTSKMFEEKYGFLMDIDLTDDNIVIALDGLQAKILEILEFEQKISNEEFELRRTETDLEQELKKNCELSLRKDKIVLSYQENINDLEEEEIFKNQKKELEAQINETAMRIENLEDKIEFLKGKTTEMKKKCQSYEGINDIFFHFLQTEKTNNKGLMKGIFEKWGEILRRMIKMQDQIQRKTWELKEMAVKYSNLEIKYNMAEATFQLNIQKIQKEYEEKHMKMLQKQDLYNVCSIESKESNTLVLKNDGMEIETNNMNNSKNNNNDIKLISFKEKRQLIRQEKLKDKENKVKIPKENALIDSGQVLKELENLKKRSPSKKRDFKGMTIPLQKPQILEENQIQVEKIQIQQKTEEIMPKFNFFPEFKDFSTCGRSFFEYKEEDYTNYRCISQYNEANSPINCLKIMEKLLFVATGNAIKVWDLECSRLINEWRLDEKDLKIKALHINRERNLLIYGYENYIELRDLYTYQKIDSLKARTPEIKDIICQDFLMFTAGKGSISRGALMLWDLRKKSWLNEFEKNSDISKILIKERVLYYGGKEKIVKRMNIDTGLNIYPYVQKHTDHITALTSLNDYIVSGCKDKTVKLWNANSFIENCTDSFNTENSVIMSLEASNCYSNVFYSGGSDGKFNVWGLNSQKIKKIYEIEAHQNSINAITESNYNNVNLLVTGSNDEIVKIWKAGDEIIGELTEMV